VAALIPDKFDTRASNLRQSSFGRFDRATLARSHYAAGAMSLTTIPWIITIITTLWFGFMAHRAERNWVLWGLGGGLFALVTSTIVFGLGHASSIPFSEHERSTLQVKWSVISFLLVGIIGWLFTLGMHRQHLLVWRLFRVESTPLNPGPATAGEPQPKSTPTPKPLQETSPAAKPPQEQRGDGKAR
jgi:hypothetical protein